MMASNQRHLVLCRAYNGLRASTGRRSRCGCVRFGFRVYVLVLEWGAQIARPGDRAFLEQLGE